MNKPYRSYTEEFYKAYAIVVAEVKKLPEGSVVADRLKMFLNIQELPVEPALSQKDKVKDDPEKSLIDKTPYTDQ